MIYDIFIILFLASTLRTHSVLQLLSLMGSYSVI